MKTKIATAKQDQVDALDWLVQRFGYQSVDALANSNGFKSPDEMAKHWGFNSIYSFLTAPGFQGRILQAREYGLSLKNQNGGKRT